MQGPNGAWNEFNDEMKSAVSLSTVMSSEAYILFYAREPLTVAHALASPGSVRISFTNLHVVVLFKD